MTNTTNLSETVTAVTLGSVHDCGQFTVPDLGPISVAIAVAREQIVGQVEAWAGAILAGDAAALDAGRRLVDSVNDLERELGAEQSIAEAFGASVLVDAVLVAIGEAPHPDPEVHARFLPARLASSRRTCTSALARAEALPVDDPRRQEAIDFYRAELVRIDAGVDDEWLVTS